MPVSYVYGAHSADEAMATARRDIKGHPVYGRIPEEPDIVEARQVVIGTGVVLSSGEELEKRRWEVYWTYPGMPDPRPGVGFSPTELALRQLRTEHSPPPREEPRSRRAASALPGASPPPAAATPRGASCRGLSGRR